MTHNLTERLKNILVSQCDFPHSMGRIEVDTPLYRNGLGLSSLDVVTLVVRVENEFAIFFKTEEVGASVETFGSLLRAVRQKLDQHETATDRNEDSWDEDSFF